MTKPATPMPYSGSMEHKDMTPAPWHQGERGWILHADGRMVTKEEVLACAVEREILKSDRARLIEALEQIVAALHEYADTPGSGTAWEVLTKLQGSPEFSRARSLLCELLESK